MSAPKQSFRLLHQLNKPSGRHGKTSFISGYTGAAATLLTAILLAGSSHSILSIPVILLGACAAALTTWWLFRIASTGIRRPKFAGLRTGLLAQLTPVICLSIGYPLAGSHLRAAHVGQVPVATFILVGSLITPWLSQVVCTPLFATLSTPAADGASTTLEGRWLADWPFAAVTSLPVAATFAVGVGLVLRWPATTIIALTIFCALNSLFSQSMVVGVLQKNYFPWAVAWLTYAIVLVVFPAKWFLPPVAALCTQLAYILATRPEWLRLTWNRSLATHFAKGALVGAVLWSDKLFYFLKHSSNFNAEFVFFGVLPAIVTHGYYFVRLAPHLDLIVVDMRATMANDSMAVSARKLRRLADQVEGSIVRFTCVGAFLCLLGVIGICLAAPSNSRLYAAMTVCSTIFMVTTILLYMLDYVGRTGMVRSFASAQLGIGALIVLLGPGDATTYILLATFSAALAVTAGRSVLASWRAPEYSLFWRYATEW